jgi:D-lactate dehydrogenase (cytochrome)
MISAAAAQRWTKPIDMIKSQKRIIPRKTPMQEFNQKQIAALSALVDADRFSTGQSNRELHLHDISPHRGTLPAGIIWPMATAEVARILSWTYENDVPVTPWGAGTSTEGNPVPTRGGLVMDMTRMNKILDIRPKDLQADVQPGVLRKELNRQTGRHGLFFPPDPGADATIGGMIANNASGVQTIKYGATKDYVMKLTVVLPAGQVIHTGCKAHKSSSGYDLTRLFVGSEGTLGIATEATLELTGIPSHHLATTFTFKDLESASEAVAVLIGSGLEPAALELLPPVLIRLMNREQHLNLPEVPSLFCEFHGVSKTMLQETADLARELCEECGATGFKFGIEEKDRRELWRARHEAWETIHRAHPKKETLVVDVAVPISRYPAMIVFAQNLVDEYHAAGYVFGHAGDGNLHVVIAGDPDDKNEWSTLEKINQFIVEKAIEVGGTCTGEHGIGIGKRKFMQLEHGESYQLMRSIKDLIDPKGLMNPGKIFL